MSNQFGPTLSADGRCQWRLWAPNASRVELLLFDRSGQEAATHPMRPLSRGFFDCELTGIPVGQRYAFRLDGNSTLPDPASRWQPDGVHRPSAVWHADSFPWNDRDWNSVARKDLVIYELHVGTFTPEGTFAAIMPRLDELRTLGVTAIELMPVAQFPGERGWGYDGVDWFAVQQSYGGPTELQRLVDACHQRGLAVILDVVYNHLGPEGDYLSRFGPFFTERHHTPWGAAVNYDGPESRPVRDFVLENVRQWIRDFHMDGLRLDAIHAIVDDGAPHILAEIKQVADEEARRLGRPVEIIAESNLNDVKLLDDPGDGGYGLDAQWSDDFHHCVHTLLTGERDGYYADFDDPPRQLAKALTGIFVHNGCFSIYRKKNWGRPIGEHAGDRFIVSIQTHDQVGNRAVGDRFGTLLTPAQQRLAAGLFLLAPNIPMLFMGEEYGEQRPFPFFCDFGDASLRQAVREGRRKEFESFAWSGELPDPTTKETFESAKLSWNWPPGSVHAGLRRLYQELLSLRRSHPALKDFVHRSAELLPPGSTDVLRLVRGDPETPSLCLHAVFNLTSNPAPWPSLDDPTDKLLLHSEEIRFAGSGKKLSPGNPLSPFAFVILSS